jgi:3-hydroxyisobutyrate dehydrogenase-like beta-hydroxyacid dehydrogenase
MTQPQHIAVICQGGTRSTAIGLFLDQINADVVFDVSAPGEKVMRNAICDADVIFSLTSPVQTFTIAEQAAAALTPGALYVDLSVGTPTFQKSLSALFPEGSYVDGALLSVTPGHDESTVLHVSGSGAQRFFELMSSSLPHLEYVSDTPGDATARKLLHDMLIKNITSVVVDTLWAAESLGMQEWAFEEIKREFDAFSGETAQHLITDAAQNFKRSQIEMADVVEMLSESGYESTMLAPVQFNYGRIMHGKKIPHSKSQK